MKSFPQNHKILGFNLVIHMFYLQNTHGMLSSIFILVDTIVLPIQEQEQ